MFDWLMGGWKEYSDTQNKVADFIPYGALIKDDVLRCKDRSYLSCIKFDSYREAEDFKACFQNFRRGWSMWTEKQHIPGSDSYLMYLSWNPFINKIGNITNFLRKSRKPGPPEEYFRKELENFFAACQGYVNGRILTGNDFLEALSFSLSFNLSEPPAPEVPMYLDYYLTKDVKFHFRENDVLIDDMKIIVVSLPSFPSKDSISLIYKAFAKDVYRHSKRILFMNEAEYKSEMNEYMGSWCQGRKSLKKFISDDIFPGQFHGLANENLIFIRHKDDTEIIPYIAQIMNLLQLPYILETFNMKDTWWGSIPGNFRANINPPAVSMVNIQEMLFPILYEGSEAVVPA